MRVSELQENAIPDELVDQILFEGLESCRDQFMDIAIVLGSSKAHLYRLPPVIEAYKRGAVRKIICSGRTRFLNGQYVNEGRLLREKALEMGVRGDDVLVEDRAANTWENLSFSRALLEQEGLLAEGMTIAIATSSYHMRRSLGLAETVFAHDSIHLVPLPGEDRSTSRETWNTNDKGRERCYGEIAGIVRYVRQGLIKDWDIL